MLRKNKNFVLNIFLSFLSILLVFSVIEIYVRIIIDDGLNLNLEMLKYAKSLKIISSNKTVGLEHKKNIKKDLRILIKNSQTPGGLNEQALKQLKRSGFYKLLNSTANSISTQITKK